MLQGLIFALIIVMRFLQLSAGGWNALWEFKDILRVIFSLNMGQTLEVAPVIRLRSVID